MESKAYQRFRSKIEYIHQHLQVLDASLKTASNVFNAEPDKSVLMANSLNVDSKTYDKLCHPIKERDRIISYSRSKVAEYTILELFGSFTNYMRDITDEMYRKEPLKIVGKVDGGSSLPYAEIIKLGSFEKIGEKMVSEIFRKFENERSTIKLIDKILSHTAVKVTKSLKEKALMYLEMRHLFIHQNGKADAVFKKNYGKHITLKANGKLPTNFVTVSAAIQTITLFAKSIDEQLIKEGLVDNWKTKN